MRKKEHLPNTIPYIHPINLWGPYILCKKVDVSFTEKLLVEGKNWAPLMIGAINWQGILISNWPTILNLGYQMEYYLILICG